MAAEMIERVARALAQGAFWRLHSVDGGFVDLKYPGGEPSYIEERWVLYIDEARLAVEAMRAVLIEKLTCDAAIFGPAKDVDHLISRIRSGMSTGLELDMR